MSVVLRVIVASTPVIMHLHYYLPFQYRLLDVVVVSLSKKKETHPKAMSTTFPATDGVNLEYFLSEISDDDSSSW